MIKNVDEGEADPDDPLVYTIEYENIGTGWASLVEILDTIPEHTTFVSATGTYTFSGDDYTWFIGDLAPGASGAITITVKVDLRTDDRTVLHNEAWLDWADANGNYYPKIYDYADSIVTAPILTFSKSTSTGTADPGDEVVYSLRYENIGSGIATLVVIEDIIPISHVTLTVASPMYDGVSGAIYSWIIRDVLPGESGEITVTVEVDVGVADQTLLHNVGTLYWADANGNYYPEIDDFANVFVTAPILEMSKEASVNEADPGDTIVFTLEYNNLGTGWASLVEIVDTLPAHVTFVSATAGYTESGNTYTWFIGDVQDGGGGIVEITVTVNVPTDDRTHLYNSATLDWADANGNYYTQLFDDAEVYVTAPILSFSKEANATTAYPLEPIVYTLEYENSGSGWATGVVIVDTISPNTNFVDSTPGYTSSVDNEYTWDIGDLRPGESGEILITVTVKDATPDTTELENFATLDWADANGNSYPQLDGYALVTVTAPIIVLDKTADKTSVNPGDILTFTLNYKNIGTGSKWGFFMDDTVPAFTTFVSADPWYTSVEGNTYRWDIGRLYPGTDEDIIFTVQVDAYTPDQTIIRNDIGNVFVEIPVTAPVMDITKTANRSEANPGDLIEYTITYENTGTGNATGVMVKDILPEDTILVSSSIPYTAFLGNTFEFFIDFVLAGSFTTFTITVMVTPGTADKTLLHNEATLDYADVNGNFYPQEMDFADVTVTAPLIVMSKEASVEEGTPSDPITYTIEYENLGTGDASSVTVIDILPLEVTYVSATPAPVYVVGNVLTWDIDDVPSGGFGRITVEVYITPRTWDQTVLHNVATLDYSDKNDNFIEQLSDDADVIVIAPVMTIDKEGGEITEEAYLVTDVRLRVAGEKWHDVKLWLFKGEEEVGYVRIVREPGDPDDQSKTIEGVTIDLMTDTYSALVQYTPFDDPVNGQWWGADPAWIIFETEYGDEVRLHHTFNVRHPDTWNWTVDDFRPYLVNLPINLKYTISYTIDYANIGTGDATNVWIYDDIPTGTTLEFSSPLPDSIIGDTVGWNIDYVPSGGSGTIFVDISFTFGNVIVKNWYPSGKILQNTATMDYHDTNGNLVEQLSDCTEVLVYVPSVLKKPKTAHYTPIYQGAGADAPENLIIRMGDSSVFLADKFLSIYEDTLYGLPSGTSGITQISDEVASTDYRILHIYLSHNPYANEPIPEITETEEIPQKIEVELPQQISMEDLPEIKLDTVVEPAIYVDVPLMIIEPVVLKPKVTISETVFESPILPKIPVNNEPKEVLVSIILEDSTSESDLTEEVEDTVVQVKVVFEEPEESKIEIVEITVENVPSEESSNDETQESHDISNLAPVVEVVSRAYLNSVYINMAVVWFVVITLIAGLFVSYKIRKRR
jgi:uncharacterized repeat protein (TIGR01451 family)